MRCHPTAASCEFGTAERNKGTKCALWMFSFHRPGRGRVMGAKPKVCLDVASTNLLTYLTPSDGTSTFGVHDVLQEVIGVQANLLLERVNLDAEVGDQVVDPLHREVAVALPLVVLVHQQRAAPLEVLEHRRERLRHLHVGRRDARQVGVLALLVPEGGGQGTCRDHRDVPAGRQPHHRRRLVLAHRPQDQVRLAHARAVHHGEQGIVHAVRVLEVDVEAEPGVPTPVRPQPPLRVKDRGLDPRVRERVRVVPRQEHQHLHVLGEQRPRRAEQRQQAHAQRAGTGHDATLRVPKRPPPLRPPHRETLLNKLFSFAQVVRACGGERSAPP